ncbi:MULTISPECIES: hypothetical protein [unclassified Frankia]|uniref:hypothetical protein n=1 Tax=unclassified Frankia TaxID=2632575 RepID=UPI001EE3A359|nr:MULTISPECIES: hypothetical protein [unclassified Frankia]
MQVRKCQSPAPPVGGCGALTCLNQARTPGESNPDFSVIQRKLLTPDDFEGLDELAAQILTFEKHSNAAARPFDWKFTRTDLNQLLTRISNHDRHSPRPQAA